MKLAKYERDGMAVTALGRTVGGELRLVDLEVALQHAGVIAGEYRADMTVSALLSNWTVLGRLLEAVDLQTLPDVAASEVKLLPPVGPGQLIVCCGFNYAEHEAEVSGSSVGATWFIKNANSVIGHGESILVPSNNGETVDYEGEIAVVFGRDCHMASVEDALDYVGGYTLLNDVSARPPRISTEEAPDDIRRGVIETFFGKQYPTFCPIGPTVLTADEVPDPGELTFNTLVNGTVKQRARLADMRLGVAELIAWLSTVFQFRAGDLISTGSPSGTGVSQQPPRFLGAGDVVTVSCPSIGELTSRVAVPAFVPAGA
jgi:2-keto-4-pentenoate hydratase/2-oxohepta-3-ene-1,7-dioic acid hydratase in catechol pathway